MFENHFFEILLYRTTEKKYEIETAKIIDRHKIGYPEIVDFPAILNANERDLRKNSGGLWSYNQVVGAIRLFPFGTQIRGELWITPRERYSRVMNNKNIYSMGSAFEVSVFGSKTNEEIGKEIITEIKAVAKNKKDVYPDLSAFLRIKDYVDWKKMVEQIDKK